MYQVLLMYLSFNFLFTKTTGNCVITMTSLNALLYIVKKKIERRDLENLKVKKVTKEQIILANS